MEKEASQVEQTTFDTSVSTPGTNLSTNDTNLSTHNSNLSVNYTDMSTNDTNMLTHDPNLSKQRTNLSIHDTNLSTHSTIPEYINIKSDVVSRKEVVINIKNSTDSRQEVFGVKSDKLKDNKYVPREVTSIFTCSMCGKNYISKSDTERHISKFHRIPLVVQRRSNQGKPMTIIREMV